MLSASVVSFSRWGAIQIYLPLPLPLFLCFCILFGCSLIVSISAVDWLDRLVPEMSYYVYIYIYISLFAAKIHSKYQMGR